MWRYLNTAGHNHPRPDRRATKSEPWGQEMAEDAAIWRTYTEEADAADAALVGEWTRNIDCMLIIATLFSAIVTAFVLDSYKSLVQDPQDLTNILLLNIMQTLQNNQTNSSNPGISNFSPSDAAIWVNGLWFTSLTLSIVAAAAAMLVKQWLNAYQSGLATSPQLRARMRQHRLDALLSWGTEELVACLPLTLSFCLMTFLAGLAVMLFTINTRIAFVCSVIIAAALILHLASLILPSLSNCQWKTAISPVIHRALYPIRFCVSRDSKAYLLYNRWRRMLRLPDIVAPFTTYTRLIEWGQGLWQSSSEVEDEMNAITRNASLLDGVALHWLIKTSTHRSVIDDSTKAIAGLRPNRSATMLLSRHLPLIHTRLLECLHDGVDLHPDSAELYARAVFNLQSQISIMQNGRGRESRSSSLIASRVRASKTSSEKSRIALIACMCACSMTNELCTVLELHCDGEVTVPKFHLRLVVEALAQEVAWRKRSTNGPWTFTPDQNLHTRITPFLVKLLDVKSCSFPNDESPQPLNTAVALALAICTEALSSLDLQYYQEEHHRISDFHYLAVACLSTILHFPKQWCEQAVADGTVLKKLLRAGHTMLRQPRRTGSDYHRASSEIFKAAYSTDFLSLPLEFLSALSQMDSKAYALLDESRYKFLEQALQNKDMNINYRLNISLCIHRLKFEGMFARTSNSDNRNSYIQIVSSTFIEPEMRSHVLQLLIKEALKIHRQKFPLQSMIAIGLLDAWRSVLEQPGCCCLSQQNIDDEWMVLLPSLCYQCPAAVNHSGFMPPLIRWSYQDYRGRSLMYKHLEKLEELALHVQTDVQHETDTSWFHSGTKRHRLVARLA